MEDENDNESVARANLARYYMAIEAISAKPKGGTLAERLTLDGFCSGPDGLCQFRDAHALAAEYALSYNFIRLSRREVRAINKLIRLERTLRKNRHVTRNEHGAPILLGSNGVVPSIGDGEDWIML